MPRSAGTAKTRPSAGQAGLPRTAARPRWAVLCVVLGGVLAILGTAGALLPRLVLDRLASAVHTQKLLIGQPRHVSITGPKNILLIGIDTRPTDGTTDGTRSDTMIIVHINAAHTAAYLISLPRDSLVTIPGFSNPVHSWHTGQAKLNAAFSYGSQGLSNNTQRLSYGTQALEKTIETDFGIGIDAAAVVNFSGFQQVVDALGGVHLCVDERTTSIHYGTDAPGHITPGPYKINSDGTLGPRNPKVQPLVYQPGCYDFNGFRALDYVRQRDLLANNDGDYGRQRHQQQLLKAVFKKVFSAGTLVDVNKLNHVINAIGSAITFDGGGISIPDWIYSMNSVTPNTVFTIRTNGGQLNGQNLPGLGSVQVLSNTSLQLLQDVKDDTVDQFVVQNPTWLAADSAG